MPSDDAVPLRIRARREIKEMLAAYREKEGMTEIATASRILEWFFDQPEVVQRTILGQVPDELAPDVARGALERLAGGKVLIIDKSVGRAIATIGGIAGVTDEAVVITILLCAMQLDDEKGIRLGRRVQEVLDEPSDEPLMRRLERDAQASARLADVVPPPRPRRKKAT